MSRISDIVLATADCPDHAARAGLALAECARQDREHVELILRLRRQLSDARFERGCWAALFWASTALWVAHYVLTGVAR